MVRRRFKKRTFKKRKRFNKMRRFRKRNVVKKTTWDGQYKARCEQTGDIIAGGLGSDSLIVDWGTNPIIAGAINQQNSPQFAQIRQLFQEYKLIGFKIKVNLIGHPVASSVNTGAFVYSGLMQIAKASLNNITLAGFHLNMQQMARSWDYKEINVSKGKFSIWIGLSKYWKSVDGQGWKQVQQYYTASNNDITRVSATQLMFNHTIPVGQRYGSYTIYTYIKFRNLVV